MIGRVHTGALQGARLIPVTVEVTTADREKERFVIVGLADAAIREAKERVSAALESSGFRLPKGITVNLAPAEVRKEGTAFDLPIALAILIATRQLAGRAVEEYCVFGELSLDGQVQKIRAPLAHALGSVVAGFNKILLPEASLHELVQVEGLAVSLCQSLPSLVASLINRSLVPTIIASSTNSSKSLETPFHGIVGQERAKRALSIAAAGGHHVLMLGPPGCGKSLLASRFPRLLPPLSFDAQKELVVITSLAGESVENLLHGIPPFRSPHHSVSEAGLIGGGSPPRAGEISLAHHGVLFLDEFAEFRRPALEALRAPLENGWVEIARSKGSERFPSSFQLLAAMNPCPCGYFGTSRCHCHQGAIQNYLKRISGPMLDRFDIQLALQAVSPHELLHRSPGSDTQPCLVLESILKARTTQSNRQRFLNRALPSEVILKKLKSSPTLYQLLESTRLSMRGMVRVIRVAQSIADLDGLSELTEAAVQEALTYRSLDRLREAHGTHPTDKPLRSSENATPR